jgi:chromosome segregation ATPase
MLPFEAMKRILISALVCLTATALPSFAQAPADPSLKLREQIKSTMLQLRSAQTETANAKAAQAVSDAKVKELEESLKKLQASKELLAKQANEDKLKNEETIAKLHNTVADRDSRIGQYQKGLAEWKDGYDKAAAVARKKEEERATLASEAIVLRRTIADRETKNISLFRTSMEILDRFEKYALGKALSAREPFIQSNRVKVESLVEGYKDKVIENRISAPTPKP